VATFLGIKMKKHAEIVDERRFSADEKTVMGAKRG
jgi:hypothetical protein